MVIAINTRYIFSAWPEYPGLAWITHLKLTESLFYKRGKGLPEFQVPIQTISDF
jgi:hypothetical protein